MNALLTKLAELKLNAVKTWPWVHVVHAGIAFGVVLLAHLFMNKYLASAVMLAVAFGIEFWFDAKYEKQGPEDNLHDFEDYIIGVLAAWLILKVF